MTSDICPRCGRYWNEHQCGSCTDQQIRWIEPEVVLRHQRDLLLAAAKAVLALPLDWIVEPDGEVFHDLEAAVKEVEG